MADTDPAATPTRTRSRSSTRSSRAKKTTPPPVETPPADMTVQAAPTTAPPAPPKPPPAEVMPRGDERVVIGAVGHEATRSVFTYPDGKPVDVDTVFEQVGKTLWRSTARVLAVQYPARAGGRAVTRLMFPAGHEFSTADVVELREAMRRGQ